MDNEISSIVERLDYFRQRLKRISKRVKFDEFLPREDGNYDLWSLSYLEREGDGAYVFGLSRICCPRVSLRMIADSI